MLTALPTTYDLTDPTQNLAGLAVTPYTAWDGEPIGYGNRCASVAAEPGLSGFDITYPDLTSPQYWWGAAAGALAVWILSRRDMSRRMQYAQGW
jgi:hypothetical protein